jgi:hypothetical protein
MGKIRDGKAPLHAESGCWSRQVNRNYRRRTNIQCFLALLPARMMGKGPPGPALHQPAAPGADRSGRCRTCRWASDPG